MVSTAWLNKPGQNRRFCGNRGNQWQLENGGHKPAVQSKRRTYLYTV
jgi:hypothetical protein